jgi:hypothetical protein
LDWIWSPIGEIFVWFFAPDSRWKTSLAQGGLGPRGRCILLGAAQCWHGDRACGGVDVSHGRHDGRVRGDVLPTEMATGPIARPMVMGWSRPRREVGRLWALRKEGEGEKLLGRLRFWPRSIVKLSYIPRPL